MHRPSEPDPAITRRLAERALESPATAAADVVAAEVTTLAGDRETAVAWPTIDVLPAAVAALLAAGDADAATLAAGIDLAASLMVLGEPAARAVGTGDDSPAHGYGGSHADTVARLVPTLLAAGITPMPGALNHTLSAATGRDVTELPGENA